MMDSVSRKGKPGSEFTGLPRELAQIRGLKRHLPAAQDLELFASIAPRGEPGCGLPGALLTDQCLV